MQRVLITGAASGIGLALCELYLNHGSEVIAVARQARAELKALNVEIVDGIDVTKPSDIEKLALAVNGRNIDLLVNCAGLLSNETLQDLDFERIQTQWEINALGPLRVTEALLPCLGQGAKIAMITSRMGSIEDNTSGSRYGYRMSKAALNIASKSLAEDLKPADISVAILHPGLVSTKMIGGHGNVSPAEAAAGLAQRIAHLNMSNTGTFWHANGEVLPW